MDTEGPGELGKDRKYFVGNRFFAISSHFFTRLLGPFVQKSQRHRMFDKMQKILILTTIAYAGQYIPITSQRRILPETAAATCAP